jgi:hypothetical protein
MISDSLLLDMERTRYLGRLDIGTAMVKLQGRWFDPFLVRFPHVKIEKGVITDEEVEKRMAGLFQTLEEDFREEAIIEPDSAPKEVFRDFRGKEKGEEEGIFGLADRLLKDVGRQRLSPASDRYRRLGTNAYQGSRARDVLLSKGLVEVKTISTKTGRLSMVSPTEKGLAVLQEWGIKPEMPNRIGGPEHVLWKSRLAEYFRGKGYTVTEEKPIGGGKTVDLVAVNGKERIAIEIETGKSDAFHNLTKDLEKDFDRVIVVELKRKEGK